MDHIDRQKWIEICRLIPQPKTDKIGWWYKVKIAYTLAKLELYE